MNFKENVLQFLNLEILREGVVKVANHKLSDDVKINDVIPGWTKIKTPALWDRITYSEFSNYVNIYIHDTEYKRGRRGTPRISEQIAKGDVKKAYDKFISLLKEEKMLKKGQGVDGSLVRSNLDKNPGSIQNMIITIFLDHVIHDAKKGHTSKSFREALLANSPEGSETHKKYYEQKNA